MPTLSSCTHCPSLLLLSSQTPLLQLRRRGCPLHMDNCCPFPPNQARDTRPASRQQPHAAVTALLPPPPPQHHSCPSRTAAITVVRAVFASHPAYDAVFLRARHVLRCPRCQVPPNRHHISIISTRDFHFLKFFQVIYDAAAPYPVIYLFLSFFFPSPLHQRDVGALFRGQLRPLSALPRCFQ